MSEETRITAKLLSKDTRITAELPLDADTLVCLNQLPKEGNGSKPNLSQQPGKDCPWLALILVSLTVVVIWLFTQIMGVHAQVGQRQAERNEMQKKTDELQKEFEKMIPKVRRDR